jgi:Fungal fruit body lectin
MIFQHSSQFVDVQQYPYRIQLNVVNQTQDQFRVIDKALRDPAIDKWTNLSGMDLQLNMTGSGRSGSILLKNDTVHELFSVTVGVHNYHRWSSIVTDLPDAANAGGINQAYYPAQHEWDYDTFKRKSSRGTLISVDISISWDGTNVAKITICKETSGAGLDNSRVCGSLNSF